jgi:hypothetical protein
MGLNIVSPIDVKQCKKFLHSVTRFGLMSRSRFEEQYKALEIRYFEAYLGIDQSKIVHVQTPR